MTGDTIYLDYASAMPMLPEVRQAMAAALEEVGNPSSMHALGQRAKRSVDTARARIAALINAKPAEIYFTSCGSESNNWALRALAPRAQRAGQARKGRHLIVSAIEHLSVLHVAKRMEREGWELTILPVDRYGLVEPETLRRALRKETVLISIMAVNNEIGTIEPVQELAAIAKERGVLMHTDAVAAAAYIKLDVAQLGVDALTLAANQFYGPSGVGALYVREGVRLTPWLDGGVQEQGRRAGTEPVVNVVGAGKAAEITCQYRETWAAQVRLYRDRLWEQLQTGVEGIVLHGHPTNRLPSHLNVGMPGVDGESLLRGMDAEGVAAGSGTACTSKAMKASHVLRAIGVDETLAKQSILCTLGHGSTEAEMVQAARVIIQVVRQLRAVQRASKTAVLRHLPRPFAKK